MLVGAHFFQQLHHELQRVLVEFGHLLEQLLDFEPAGLPGQMAAQFDELGEQEEWADRVFHLEHQLLEVDGHHVGTLNFVEEQVVALAEMDFQLSDLLDADARPEEAIRLHAVFVLAEIASQDVED